MRRRLPSLLALEAFESVARLGSTSRASRELGRTQSAVSRQVLNLEQFIESPLFNREHNKLVLNAAGDFLFESIGITLDRMETALIRTSTFGQNNHKLRLRVWPTFGARWLMSRLVNLPSELGLDVSVSTGLEQVYSLDAPDVDGIFLYGSGDWPDVTSSLILREELIAVTSPQLEAKRGPDIASYDWFTMDSRPDAWSRWLAGRADAATPAKVAKPYRIGLLTELLCLGTGAAVIPSVYVRRELESGALVAPFGEALPSGNAYYFCCRRENADRPQMVAFREWLLSTC
jgi:LysR family glycine cleavage system transcriptional activator